MPASLPAHEALAPVTAFRIVSGKRRGSSRPIIVETADGRRFVKLRGASQGTGALVAEIIVAALAERLGLRVPKRSLVELLPNTPTDDHDDELADLLRASVGLNLGFEELAPARDAQPADLDRIGIREKATVLWLDRFVMNPDRTIRNPNLLVSKDGFWLIDHGAALRFQYNWPSVTESMPRAVGSSYERHLFEDCAVIPDWKEIDLACAGRLDRSHLERAVDLVPESFLVPMFEGAAELDESALAETMARRRGAYVAFLWKRLKAPRAFAQKPIEEVAAGQRGIVPAWVSAKR
ncbi:MAG: HipA family kinase [Vicinamibacteria bacterium]